MDIDPSKFHRIFDAITENIFYKDTKGRYMLCTHVCSMINASGDPNFTIIGKTDADFMPDKELGQRFLEEDLKVVATRSSMKYVQEMKFGAETYFYEISKSPVIDHDGEVIGVVGVIKDMTEFFKMQKELEEYSITDKMTQTFNRTFFESGKYKENLQYPVCVIIADVNDLKYFNDNYGHKEGDMLIKTVVNNIDRQMRPQDLMIRLGGDEFLIILQNCALEEGHKVVAAIKDREANIKLCGVNISTSYGINTAFSESELDASIEKADHLMYDEKKLLKRKA